MMILTALTLLLTSLAIWAILLLILRGRFRVRSRYELGGGLPRYGTDFWSLTSELRERFLVDYQDVKLLDKVFSSASTKALEELELITKESSHKLAERLRRLESLGLIIKTSSGTYEMTDYGRKVLEMYREKLRSRRRDEEVVEGL